MSPPAVTQHTLERLAFIRYLLALAQEQSRAPEPMSTAAVLTVHDAVEMALHLAAELINVGTKKTDFMQYFDLLDTAHGGKLAATESMRRLNNARVALKHSGVRPAPQDVAGFLSAADLFLTENAPRLFGVRLDDVSLAQLIALPDARAQVEHAERCVAEGRMPDALEHLSLAFEHLKNAYVSMSTGQMNLPYIRQLNRYDFDGVTGELQDAIRAMVGSVERLAREVGQLRLGLDPVRLALFQQVVPSAVVATSGVSSVWRRSDVGNASAEDVRFCHGFVIESALRLQRSGLVPLEMLA